MRFVAKILARVSRNSQSKRISAFCPPGRLPDPRRRIATLTPHSPPVCPKHSGAKRVLRAEHMASIQSMGRAKWIFAGLLLVILAASAGGYFWKKRERPVTVQTDRVARRDLTERVVANGRIQPVTQVVIQPEVSGEIVELPVKEGDAVRRGDLLLRIKPDNYIAQRNSAEASYRSSVANSALAQANLDKAAADFARFQELFETKLVSDSQFLDAKTSLAVAQASYRTSTNQVEMAKAALARVEDDLAKTTITAPIDGTVTKLRVERGERVVGTAMMAGTEIMTIARLDEMEARAEFSEVDIVLIKTGQKARLEVDAFRREKFTGTVTEIANAAKTSAGGTQQEATKFEVKIRVREKAAFRPGMSVTAEIETRYRTNVLTVPIQSVTTRLPKGADDPAKKPKTPRDQPGESEKKKNDAPKSEEVIFAIEDGKARRVKVERGIADNNYYEIISGVTEGQEIVSGDYRAINRELEDGRKIKVRQEKPTGAAQR